jgi:hypothetical protein
MADSAVVDSALVDAALYKIDVPAISYIYAAYDKSSLILITIYYGFHIELRVNLVKTLQVPIFYSSYP